MRTDNPHKAAHLGTTSQTRRAFLSRAGGVLGVTLAAAQWPSIAAAQAHAAAAATAKGSTALGFFAATDARDVDSIAAQIIPTDESPGAREAGALYFIDRSLQSWLAPRAAVFRAGLADFQAKFAAHHPGVVFAGASEPAQHAFLASVDTTPFFRNMRMLTLVGLFALPQYGGNRDGIGWKLIGFEDQHVFAPPFGYYDRDYPGFKLPDAKA